MVSEQQKTVFHGPLYFVDSFFSLLRQEKKMESFLFPPERKLTSETNRHILFNWIFNPRIFRINRCLKSAFYNFIIFMKSPRLNWKFWLGWILLFTFLKIIWNACHALLSCSSHYMHKVKFWSFDIAATSRCFIKIVCCRFIFQ